LHLPRRLLWVPSWLLRQVAVVVVVVVWWVALLPSRILRLVRLLRPV
jgi:hypothetical protein